MVVKERKRAAKPNLVPDALLAENQYVPFRGIFSGALPTGQTNISDRGALVSRVKPCLELVPPFLEWPICKEMDGVVHFDLRVVRRVSQRDLVKWFGFIECFRPA